MEVVSCCSGRAWRVVVTATDERARRVVSNLLPAPQRWSATAEGWTLDGPRDFATDGDPLVTLTVGTPHGRAVASATLETRMIRLRSGTVAVPSALRVARAEETIEAALRWVLGLGHLGCISPDELSFWARRVEGRVFVITEWVASGAPLPLAGIEGYPGVAVLLTGADVRFRQLQQAVDLLGARIPHAVIGGGIFVTDAPGARALVVVADLRE